MSSSEETSPDSPDDNAPANAWIPHVVPFVAWMFCFQMLGDPTGWKYALRTVVCLGIFIGYYKYYNMGRWYQRLNPKHILPSILVGIFIFIVWVLPESPLLEQIPGFRAVYQGVFTQNLLANLGWLFRRSLFFSSGLWSIVPPLLLTIGVAALRPWLRPKGKSMPLGFWIALAVIVAGWLAYTTDWLRPFMSSACEWLQDPPLAPWTESAVSFGNKDLIYHPDVCGWPLTVMRILGSAFVISVIEEFFWRGWMYRWIISQNFLKVDIGKLKWGGLLAAAVMFSLVHHRWLAAVICGLCYGLLIIKTRDIWAGGIAHATTNLLLGVYVVAFDQYYFWS